MPNLKLQVSRALNVIPSDYTNIPMPNVITYGNITGINYSSNGYKCR